MTDLLTGSFQAAVRDYFFLRNNGYPEKPTLKLVGDRYRLTGVQRTVLFRGIAPAETARKRREKIIPAAGLAGKALYVDGYNVLFNVMNYLLGKAVFIGNDGIMRDAGDYGAIENEELFYRAMDMLLEFIQGTGAASSLIYLDRTVPGIDVHRDALAKRMQGLGLSGRCCAVPSADGELKKKTGGVVATSDSEIIDATPCFVVDAARHALETQFKINVPDLATAF